MLACSHNSSFMAFIMQCATPCLVTLNLDGNGFSRISHASLVCKIQL